MYSLTSAPGHLDPSDATAARIEAFLAPFDDPLIDAARLAPGQRVLDLGCGTGSTAVLAANAVGTGGAVLAVDRDESAVSTTAYRLRGLGPRNGAGLADLDLGVPAGPWDRVVSRFVLMLLSDPVDVLRQVRGVLEPGGRAALMVWDRAVANPWHTVPFWAIAPAGTARPAHGGRPFGLGDPCRLVLAARAAGFAAPVVTTHTCLLTAGPTLCDAVDLALADAGLHGSEAEARLVACLSPFVDDDGAVRIPASALVLEVDRRR